MELIKPATSDLKKNILIISIAVVFAFFIGYGIETFHPSPKYEDFCREQPSSPIVTEESCVNASGTWVPDSAEGKAGWCDMSRCQNEFQSVMQPYDRIVFIATLIIGVIAIIVGGLLLTLESVSSGIMAGGMLTIIYGTLRYWGYMPDVIRFVVLGSVLAILIWLGYKKMKK